jgi:DMSO reductase anchor subunit
VPVYLSHALATGALLLHVAAQAWGRPQAIVGLVALAAVALAALAKHFHWAHVDAAKPVATAESATGLGALGKVRLLDAPHTEENYLQQEMGFRIARKHAEKLRAMVRHAAYHLPFLLTAAALLLDGVPAFLAAGAAAIFGLAGTLVERWLFFAEAKHVVMLYYGERAV